MIIEISSYPKSGNTWFRALTRNYLQNAIGEDYFPQDIHQEKELTPNSAKKFTFENQEVAIYKSHTHNNSQMSPDKIIHIYRHPLDVFFSALNRFYHQAVEGKHGAIENFFINKQPKHVDTIFEDGEMDYYFSQFLETAGLEYFPKMLGEKSNYFAYALSALNCEKTINIRYEDLVANTELTVNKTFQKALSTNVNINIDVEEINSKTKGSTNKKFFWKSKPQNYLEYLTEEQIQKFQQKYKNELQLLGYN